MDRLTSVCFQAGTCPGASDPFIRWSYDGVGNRLTETRPTGTTTYTYNLADELTQAGSTSYTYDQDGNQLTAGTRAFAYDLANRLKSTTLGNTTTSYLYDGDGKRLQASTGPQANKTTNFLWDLNQGIPQTALERDGNNALIRRYAYGARRISQTAGANTSYYLHDGLGSVANLTSSSGATQWTWSYEPYGTIRTEQKANGNQPDNPMKFTGEYLDPTGLYHLRARQYDPTSGRFAARDSESPAWVEPYVSAYAYVNGRPTLFVDPTGRSLGGCVSHPIRCAENSAIIKTLKERRNRAIATAVGVRTPPPADTGFAAPPPGSKLRSSWPFAQVATESVVGFDTLWNGARVGGLAVACYEGYALAGVAGPLWGVAGCLTVAIAFDLSAENARRRIEEVGDY